MDRDWKNVWRQWATTHAELSTGQTQGQRLTEMITWAIEEGIDGFTPDSKPIAVGEATDPLNTTRQTLGPALHEVSERGLLRSLGPKGGYAVVPPEKRTPPTELLAGASLSSFSATLKGHDEHTQIVLQPVKVSPTASHPESDLIKDAFLTRRDVQDHIESSAHIWNEEDLILYKRLRLHHDAQRDGVVEKPKAWLFEATLLALGPDSELALTLLRRALRESTESPKQTGRRDDNKASLGSILVALYSARTTLSGASFNGIKSTRTWIRNEFLPEQFRETLDDVAEAARVDASTLTQSAGSGSVSPMRWEYALFFPNEIGPIAYTICWVDPNGAVPFLIRDLDPTWKVS